MSIKTRIQNKRDTSANWELNNPVLLNGEVAIVDDGDNVKLKIGNGTDRFSSLPYLDDDILANIEAIRTNVNELQGNSFLSLNSDGLLCVRVKESN